MGRIRRFEMVIGENFRKKKEMRVREKIERRWSKKRLTKENTKSEREMRK